MKRIPTAAYLNPNTHQELLRQTAFHEAGHAVAIYLLNKQKQLPPVFFQISLDAYEPIPLAKKYLAKVEGGHLVENLPLSLMHLPEQEWPAYLEALEADIVNLLAGPLAEAQYIALRDGEMINRNIINLNALSNYGGAADLELAQEYIQCFISNSQQQLDKVETLFHEAFDFITARKNWKIINTLAQYIISCRKKAISCEEVITVIEQTLN